MNCWPTALFSNDKCKREYFSPSPSRSFLSHCSSWVHLVLREMERSIISISGTKETTRDGEAKKGKSVREKGISLLSDFTSISNGLKRRKCLLLHWKWLERLTNGSSNLASSMEEESGRLFCRVLSNGPFSSDKWMAWVAWVAPVCGWCDWWHGHPFQSKRPSNLSTRRHSRSQRVYVRLSVCVSSQCPAFQASCSTVAFLCRRLDTSRCCCCCCWWSAKQCSDKRTIAVKCLKWLNS